LALVTCAFTSCCWLHEGTDLLCKQAGLLCQGVGQVHDLACRLCSGLRLSLSWKWGLYVSTVMDAFMLVAELNPSLLCFWLRHLVLAVTETMYSTEVELIKAHAWLG
jgi:hypothetical protein